MQGGIVWGRFDSEEDRKGAYGRSPWYVTFLNDLNYQYEPNLLQNT